jgi:hypothetical protein
VNATKEIAAITGGSARSSHGGNADNRITAILRDIYASMARLRRQRPELCISDSERQRATVRHQSNSPPVRPNRRSRPPASVIPHAPVIELNGNASSTIEVGNNYA